VEEEREVGFENRIPAISGAGAGEREREVGAGGAVHARGVADVAREEAEAWARRCGARWGDGSDRWALPVGRLG
jgi:hypothetical protein